jgi:hypothetical protein
MAPTATRAARNEDQFRQLNESLEAWNEAHAWFDPSMPHWRCECAKLDCSEAVAMTVNEYQEVRGDPTHFLIAPSPDHVEPEFEYIVARFDRYWVVEKTGEAGDVAERLDERRD